MGKRPAKRSKATAADHELLKARTAELRQINQALVQEIAKRQQAEAVLARQAAELSRSNAELEQFAYVASHDLQEPLRTVASYTELLELRYGAQLDDQARTYIGFAVAGVTRMRELISDLLNFSCLHAPPRDKAPVPCAAVFAQALANLEATIRQHGARATAGPLPTVQGEFGQLVELLQNLIANGIKFNQSACPTVHVTAREEAAATVFAVCDNGIGIAHEYWERIFVMFQRLHSREQYEGTGIGLTLCKKIVERHGGRIWVESNPGQGSTIYFTIARPTDDATPGGPR